MNNGYIAKALSEADTDVVIINPFIRYNLAVAREQPRAWAEGSPALKSKVLFQEYRFGSQHPSKQNTVAVHMSASNRREMTKPILSIGSLPGNDVVITDSSVSRRHAAIVNFPDDVWVHDPGSTCGTEVNGKRLTGRIFLDGAHDIKVGRIALRIGAATGLLR